MIYWKRVIARHARERFMPSLDRTPTTPYGTWICSLHGRWVEIRKPEGDTLRPCPECPPGYPSPKIKSGRPLTGLTS